MNKQEVINNLNNMIKYYDSKNETSRKERIKQVKRLVTKSSIQEYNSVILSQNNNVNIGLIIETLVLNKLGLKSEDDNHEIKSLVCNRWNVLTNKNVKCVYIYVLSAKMQGLYKLDKPNLILNKSIGFKELQTLPLEKIGGIESIL